MLLDQHGITITLDPPPLNLELIAFRDLKTWSLCTLLPHKLPTHQFESQRTDTPSRSSVPGIDKNRAQLPELSVS